MRPVSCFVIFLLFASFISLAQDTLVLKNGRAIAVRGISVSVNDVMYHLWERADSLCFVRKCELKFIKCQMGDLIRFDEELCLDAEQDTCFNFLDSVCMYKNGKQDASVYYKGRGASTSIFFLTALYPPLGAIYGVLKARSKLDPYQDQLPDAKLLKNPNYYQGFVESAKNKRKRKIITSVVAATLMDAAIIGLTIYSLDHLKFSGSINFHF